jgi:2-polyprenyl-3-methyl-5-hydroxy-6-metoxy-1,4-benzoquinol methylase
MSDARYTGTENLEVMKEAVNYNRALLSLVTTHARKGSRIVDFGAGVGTFAIPLHRAGYDVECVELDDAQRGVIEANGLPARPTLAGIGDASVDFVYTFNVLEHIKDDAAALAEIGRTLRDRGKLLVYVPAFDLLYTSMDRRVGHLRRYRRGALRRKVEAAGFDVLAAEYVDSLGFLAALAYRVAGSASGDIDRRALRLYDRFVFPVSRWSDRALKRVIGKNVLIVAERRA